MNQQHSMLHPRGFPVSGIRVALTSVPGQDKDRLPRRPAVSHQVCWYSRWLQCKVAGRAILVEGFKAGRWAPGEAGLSRELAK